MNANHKLQVIGIDFNSASHEERVEFHLTPSQIVEIYQRKMVSAPFFILSTCNRTEIFLMGSASVQTGFQAFETIFRGTVDQTHLYSFFEDAAWLHLLELAVGLKSMLIGETEILGQLQAAILLSLEYGGMTREHQSMFEKVIAAARRIRHRTKIGGFSSSLYTLTVRELNKARAEFADLKALILGNGAIARNLAQVFRNHGLSTTILARSPGKKRYTKPQPVIDGVAVVFGYEHLQDLLEKHTVIITATTAPHYLLKAEHREFLKGKILIDLAFPRNIDPSLARNDGRFWDLEYFAELSRANRVNKAQAMVDARIQCVSVLERNGIYPKRPPAKADSAVLTG